MIKCCIFDLDGTILDTISTITHYVNKTFHQNGIDKITADECKYFVGDGARELIKRALASKGISDTGRVEDILKQYKSAYDLNPLYLTSVFPGIYDVLSELSGRGIKLAVVSNKPDLATKNVIRHFFSDRFDAVVGSVEGVPLKPNPTVAEGVLYELGITPSETAWIGDTATDIKTAKNLNAALSVGVLWGFREREELAFAGADAIVSKADEIVREVLSVV